MLLLMKRLIFYSKQGWNPKFMCQDGIWDPVLVPYAKEPRKK